MLFYSLHVLLWLLYGLLSNSRKFYSNREILNETYYGKTRYSVEGFIDHHRMSLLERLLKRNRHHFKYQPQNYYNLEELEQGVLFKGIDAEDMRTHQVDKCDLMIRGQSCYDRALQVLVKNHIKYNNTLFRELREEIEAYVHIRDKLLEYASEVFNTTVVPSVQGDGVYFYYFEPHTPISGKINGRGYILLPHDDYYPLTDMWGRPLKYVSGFKLSNPARRYSATMYFDDIPADDGGQFEWYDFPNNNILPAAQGRILSIEKIANKSVNIMHSPSFADPNLNVTRIQPRKGTLLLFSAQDDIHGVREYRGAKERWGFMMALSDKATMEAVSRNEIPYDILTKDRPVI